MVERKRLEQVKGFEAFDVVHVYTREQAIGDGCLLDAQEKPFAEVTREFFGDTDVAVTAAVAELIRQAVESETHYNDFNGVWHDILWMGQFPIQDTGSRRLFKVIINGPPGDPERTLQMTATLDGRWANHAGTPVAVTFMLPGEE